MQTCTNESLPPEFAAGRSRQVAAAASQFLLPRPADAPGGAKRAAETLADLVSGRRHPRPRAVMKRRYGVRRPPHRPVYRLSRKRVPSELVAHRHQRQACVDACGIDRSVSERAKNVKLQRTRLKSTTGVNAASILPSRHAETRSSPLYAKASNGYKTANTHGPRRPH